MKLFIGIVLAALLAFAGALVDNAKFAAQTGTQLTGGAKVSIEEGQPLAGTVVNPKLLAKLGIPKTAAGDAMEITVVSLRDNKVKLMHVPSMLKVTVVVGGLN